MSEFRASRESSAEQEQTSQKIDGEEEALIKEQMSSHRKPLSLSLEGWREGRKVTELVKPS